MNHSLHRSLRALAGWRTGQAAAPWPIGPRPLSPPSTHDPFDRLARELADSFSRREALRRLALGVAAGVLAEFTDLLAGSQRSPASAAARPVPAAGRCSTAQTIQCLQAAQLS